MRKTTAYARKRRHADPLAGIRVLDRARPFDEGDTTAEHIKTRACFERLCRLFHPFSDQAGDVIGVLRALRGLHPNSSAHTPGYLQLLPRL